MDFLVQDANLVYQDFPNLPNEVLFLLASLFVSLLFSTSRSGSGIFPFILRDEMSFHQEDAWDDLAREEDHLDHRNYHAVMLAYGKALRALVRSLPPLEYAQWAALYLARRWVARTVRVLLFLDLPVVTRYSQNRVGHYGILGWF